MKAAAAPSIAHRLTASIRPRRWGGNLEPRGVTDTDGIGGRGGGLGGSSGASPSSLSSPGRPDIALNLWGQRTRPHMVDDADEGVKRT
ncbi:MAG: hypothetical protein CMJ83_17695 [Planctomycetes bacterium]|nr:hypothetical protein [Planctomycetota bacterium]